jgi:hypothetical protein
VTLVGGDVPETDIACQLDPLSDECIVEFTIRAVARGVVSFAWDYQSFDLGNARFDKFGFFLDGSFNQLSDDGGPAVQSGFALFPIVAGNIFGFYIDCTDCIDGPAIATISDFSVPEPASVALAAVGLAGLVLIRKRRQIPTRRTYVRLPPVT